MLQLTAAHHRVLYSALDGFNLQALMSSLTTHIGNEEVTVLEPLAPEAAQAACLDLLSEGYVTVFYRADLAGQDAVEDRYLSTDEDRALLEDPVTWDRDSDEGITLAWTHELHLTPIGREAFGNAHARFGGRIDEISKRAREEVERVEREHPEFFEKKEHWFRDLEAWVDKGRLRRMPRPPKWPSSGAV